jgi:hypothetical protein
MCEPNTKGCSEQTKEETEQDLTHTNYLQILIGYVLGMLFVSIAIYLYDYFTQRKNQSERSDRLDCPCYAFFYFLSFKYFLHCQCDQ